MCVCLCSACGVNPHRERQTIPQGQTSEPAKQFSSRQRSKRAPRPGGARDDGVRTQETSCSSDSRFRRKLAGTTAHRLLGTQRPQMLCVAAWAGPPQNLSLHLKRESELQDVSCVLTTAETQGFVHRARPRRCLLLRRHQLCKGTAL